MLKINWKPEALQTLMGLKTGERRVVVDAVRALALGRETLNRQAANRHDKRQTFLMAGDIEVCFKVDGLDLVDIIALRAGRGKSL